MKNSITATRSVFFTLVLTLSTTFLTNFSLADNTQTATNSTTSTPPNFTATTLDSHAGDVVYDVHLADVDGDKREDVIAVTENRVIWYQNPDWKPRTIIENQTERDNVSIAAKDIDGDGHVDFALAAGWPRIGTLHWLRRGAKLDDRWTVHPIGGEPSLHRLTWGNIAGRSNGIDLLVGSPLAKSAGEGVRLIAFEIPADPVRGPWKPIVLHDSLNMVHGHWTAYSTADRLSPIAPAGLGGEVLAASREGVFVLQHQPDGAFVATKISSGTNIGIPAPPPGNTPTTGAGEIRPGKTLRDGETVPLIATIEPMHGNEVVVYTPVANQNEWKRTVLDKTLRRGHALFVGDFDGRPGDEIVVGHSHVGPGPFKGPGVFLYARNDAGEWTKHVIDDGGVACEDLTAADLDGDGDLDIVACGRETHNVKLYRNQLNSTPEANPSSK